MGMMTVLLSMVDGQVVPLARDYRSTLGKWEWLVKPLLYLGQVLWKAGTASVIPGTTCTVKGLNSLCSYLGQIIEEGSLRLCFLPGRITGINSERGIYLFLRSGNALSMGMPWFLLTGDGVIKIVIQQFILGPNNGPASVVFWEFADINFFLTLSLIPFACSVVVYTSPVYDPSLRVKTQFRLYLRSLFLTLLHAVWWSTHPQCMTPAFGLNTHFRLYLRSLFLTLFACSVVVCTSPVYDPSLRVKTHFCLYLRSLSLIPFACSVVVYTSPVYDPGLRVKTHFPLYLRSLSLIPFACSVVVYTSPVYDPGLRVKTHFRLYLLYSTLWPAICSNVMTLKITLRLWLTDK